MRKLVVYSVLAMLAGLSFAAAPTGAVAVGCNKIDDGARANVVAPPAAAFGVNWAPDCVVVKNGGTVVWTQADAIPHGARIKAVSAGSEVTCLDLGSMLAGQSNGVAFLFDADAEILAVAPLLTPGATPPALSSEIEECPSEAFTRDGDALTIKYDCRIHGALMPGRVIVEL